MEKNKNLTQKEINSTINNLFDEFINSGCDINKMDPHSYHNNDNDDNNCDDNKNIASKNIASKNTSKLKSENNEELSEIEKKIYFEDGHKNIDFSGSFIGDLLNNFLIYFKQKTNKPSNTTLLDGIDVNDPYSTNVALEEMFYEMSLFLECEKNNPKSCEIIKFSDLKKSDMSEDGFNCLLIDGEPAYVSKSFFSLLIELTEIKKEHDDMAKKKDRENKKTYNIIIL